MKGEISASLMCCDQVNMINQLEIIEKNNIEYLHFDIMDGHFVPNITLGTELIKAVRKVSKVPFDIHLMVERPEKMLSMFDIKPGDFVSFHCESTTYLQSCLQRVKDMGAKGMVALNPATPLCFVEEVLDDIDAVLLMSVNPGFAGQKFIGPVMNKVKRLREKLDNLGYENIKIEIDGNVSFELAPKLKEAGADIYVVGSSGIFSKADTLENNIKRFRDLI